MEILIWILLSIFITWALLKFDLTKKYHEQEKIKQKIKQKKIKDTQEKIKRTTSFLNTKLDAKYFKQHLISAIKEFLLSCNHSIISETNTKVIYDEGELQVNFCDDHITYIYWKPNTYINFLSCKNKLCNYYPYFESNIITKKYIEDFISSMKDMYMDKKYKERQKFTNTIFYDYYLKCRLLQSNINSFPYLFNDNDMRKKLHSKEIEARILEINNLNTELYNLVEAVNDSDNIEYIWKCPLNIQIILKKPILILPLQT